MHLSVLVIDGHIFLDGGRYRGVVYDNRGGAGLGIYYKFQHIEKLTGVPTAVTHESLGFPDLNLFVLKEDILPESTVQKSLQIFLLKGFKDKDLAAGQKGSNNLK